MESDLFKQFEKKKKEMIEIENAMEHFREKSPIQYNIWFHKFEIIVKEIAILEQAIAEIEKQRQEILDKIEKICNDNQMYADMDEDDFWRTSTISPQDAQKRADYNYELLEYLKKLLGEKEFYN